MNNYDVERKWNEFVAKLNERAPERYDNRKTFDGDPRGNYDVPGDFNKLARGEKPKDYYSQEEVVGSNTPRGTTVDDRTAYMGNDPADSYMNMTGMNIDGRDHYEVERALRDAMDALGQADPAEVYEKLMALHDMIELMPSP